MADQIKALAAATSCLDTYEKTLHDRINQLKDWRRTQQVAVELVQKFPEAMASSVSYESVETRVSFTLDDGTWKALIIGKDCKMLSEVIGPLRFLREKLGKYTVSDDPESRRRIYTFENEGYHVIFQAFFWGLDESQVCKFVEVAKKEMPIYKLMCGDQEVNDDVEVPG